MADNYLEKKMEEHQRGSTTKHSRPISPSGTPKGSVLLSLAWRRVFVIGLDRYFDTGRAIVKAFGNAGCEVGFACTDLHQGRVLAQSTASRHYPMEFEAALTHFTETKGYPDLIVMLTENGAEMHVGNQMFCIAGSSEEIADTALTLSLVSSRILRSILFTPKAN